MAFMMIYVTCGCTFSVTHAHRTTLSVLPLVILWYPAQYWRSNIDPVFAGRTGYGWVLGFSSRRWCPGHLGLILLLVTLFSLSLSMRFRPFFFSFLFLFHLYWGASLLA